MVRRLTLVLTLAVLFIPGGAFALGLGEIHLKSALNQAFDARIDLLSVKADELDGVKITLASPKAFKRAGVDRLFILTKLRYEADLNKDGQAVIHVTSRQAIHEPFLNFLIEVNWAKGRLVREYTVLLDPPVTLDRKPAAVSVPVTAAPVSRTVQPAPAIQQRQPVAEQRKPAVAVAAPQMGAADYGPVMANETLWPIALKTKPQGVSVEQMMIALQRKNPQAFIRQNVNNLKRGSILRMPTQEEIDLLSVREARAEFSNQIAEWKTYRATSASNKVASGSSETSVDKETSLPTSKLKLASVRPEGEGKGGASEGDGSEEIASKLENELILVREQFESAKQERTNLNSQVSQLESQLADLENLLVVRNEQLARLQSELQKSEDNAVETVAEVPVEQSVVDAESDTVEVATEVAEETIELTVDDSEEALEDTEQAASPAPAAVVPAAAPEAGPIEFILDFAKSNMIAVAGGGLVILLLLLVLARRNKAESAEFEESILVGTQGDDTEALDSAGNDTEGVMSEAAETSFLSEFSHEDMDAAQDDTGEVDPIAEADVYIAYGRYQQAEELLQQAIARDPNHAQSYFKLLEILFVTKDAQAFTEIAETLATKNPEQVDADGWQQALAMGHQLNPEHELFVNAESDAVDHEQPAVAPVEMEPETTADEPDEDLDLMELSDLTADFDSGDDLNDEGGAISALLEDDGLDFDLNLGLDAAEDIPVSSDESDDELLSADVGEISADSGLGDALTDLSSELSDSSIPELDAESEPSELSELEESLSLDGLDLEDSFVADVLEEEESEPSDQQDEVLGGSEDLAAALSDFTDELVPEATTEGDDLSLNDDLVEVDELNDLGNLGEELEGLTADLSIEEDNSVTPEESLDDLAGLDESLSLDDVMEESADSSDEALESDELVLGDLEQDVSTLEAVDDQDDLLADVSLDDLELGESSEPENEGVELSEGDDELPDLSDEDLMMGDDLDESSSLGEPLSELLEEPDKIDEINTKLDLARAYVEMGDEEGARNILDEVLNEGDDAQKEDAQELLGRLS